ncbi:DegV family protein [Lagierella sp.]|uniref:DegV family protein n=1 Tax=Lagierella sp. TaxID=2849657 RepID=UPI00260A554F|nr:DegV family protein [Lagierella sp.]
MQKRLIVADSGCDLSEEIKKRLNIEIVPFNIDIDGESIMDTPDVDKKSFMKKMRKSSNPVRSAAPSPNLFMEKFKDFKEILVITISQKLSGTYNNAVLAKNMFLEEVDAKIHVFDSKSASSGETAIAMKIQELMDQNFNFEEIVTEVEDFISNMKSYFILDDFDNLIKNGRMSKITGTIAKFLSFKPVMQGVDGEIQVFAKTRGQLNALNKLVEAIGMEKKLDDRNLVISHCEALETALKLKKAIEQKYKFKSIQIVETGLLASVYANRGGIVVCF